MKVTIIVTQRIYFWILTFFLSEIHHIKKYEEETVKVSLEFVKFYLLLQYVQSSKS